MTTTKSTLFPQVKSYIEHLDDSTIDEKRKKVLQPLIDFIQKKVNEGRKIRLIFICTHNSRRSHLSQIWAQVMAYYYKINNVFCYSAGTEETALFPMISETLSKTGFDIIKLSGKKNPIYNIDFTDNEPPIIGFSKKIDHSFNPKSNFAAIMTCSQADQVCPFVPGAEVRIPITFEDPKIYDGTPEQAAKYEERSSQIATEMKFIFSQIKKI